MGEIKLRLQLNVIKEILKRHDAEISELQVKVANLEIKLKRIIEI